MILIHYAEIGIKGKNRNLFESRLIENIKTALEGVPYRFVQKISGRILVRMNDGLAPDDEKRLTRDRLARTFGIASILYVQRERADIEAMRRTAVALIKGRGCRSFAVHTKRSNKKFLPTSMEVNAQVGQYIKDTLRIPVHLTDPQCACTIEITEDGAFVGVDSYRGPGGMPVGSSGAVCALISGGIDSPVAAWHMMKRGARVHYIHFHTYPYADRASIEKVEALVKILNEWHGTASLVLVPFTDIQKSILLGVAPRYRMVLYRRAMMRIAEKLAGKLHALSLVTGESLGQVASQTLENIAVIDNATTMPVLRPLIGMDKEEIIIIARTIRTYDTSILPHTDCCTLFVPKHPATKARLNDVEREEAKIPLAELIQEAVERTQTRKIESSIT